MPASSLSPSSVSTGPEVAAEDDSAGGVLPLDRPPTPEMKIHWPRRERPCFLIFADAEEEFDWTKGIRRDQTSTTAILQLPVANRRFVERGCRPTYLVDWPVVDQEHSAAAIAAMVAAGECEIGTQLHPWVNPPFEETVSTFNSFTGNLPVGLQERKLVALTERIAQACGHRPVIYRAGRYGIGPATAQLLVRHGYRMDVSIRSGFYYGEAGGPDFRNHPFWPWRLGGGLYELPLTSGWVGWGRRWRRLLQSRLGGKVAGALNLFERIALTPEGMPLAGALALIDQLLDEGHSLFSMSFHTPSIVPGHSPYVRDARDLDNFWRWWDGVFDRFADRGVEAIGGKALIAAFDRLQAPDGHTHIK